MRALPIVLSLAFLLPGCASAPAGPFAVVSISGQVQGSGPQQPPGAVCGIPLFPARYDLAARDVEVLDRVRPAWSPRLVVVEDVDVSDPADASGCGPWPRVTASRDGALAWTWRLHGHETTLPIEVRDGAVLVEGRALAPGESRDVPVAFAWDAPWNASYRYEGSIHVESRGAWPASSLRTVGSGQGNAEWSVEDG